MAKDNYGHFKEFADEVEGYEGIDMSTMAIPFIRLIQSLSPQLKKTKAEFIADAKEGDICNSVTSSIYPEPLRLVIGKFERLMIEWKPSRGGFVQAHAPESIEGNPRYQMVTNSDGKLELIDTQSQNIIVDTYMYYIMLPDHMDDGICVMACSSTQLKEARRLNRILKTTIIPGTTQKALPHFMVFELTTTDMSKGEHDWKGIHFEFKEFVTPELLADVRTEREELPNKKVDYAQIDDQAGKPKKDDGDVPY